MGENRVCKVCGGPITARNKAGICARTQECRDARDTVKPCRICAGPTKAVSGVCRSMFSPECLRWHYEDEGKVHEARELAEFLRSLAHYLETHPGDAMWIYTNHTSSSGRANKLRELKPVCEICGNRDEVTVIDHDHRTGYVRGILCNSCNGWLGSYRDSAPLLRRYAEVLTTPGMPNPTAQEIESWDLESYIRTSDSRSVSFRVDI